jgi:competence ComEA-like helix-hairpin-helix protein
MTQTSSARRTNQPLQIGSRHGYRIEGDVATINAELSVPPYHPGGSWALQLWASDQAQQAGPLSGVKVSEVRFELPTPLAPHTHRVEAQVPAQLPLQGRSHAMLLALVEQGSGYVHDVANYPERETFSAPQLEGDVGYEIRGREVLLQVSAVSNPRAAGNLSGTLSLELWALPADTSSDVADGHCLASAQLAPLAGGEAATGLHCRAAFSEPPSGRFELVLRLREWTRALGYVTRDQRSFALPYEVAALPEAQPEPPALSVELPSPADAVSVEPSSLAALAEPLPEPEGWEVPQAVPEVPAVQAAPEVPAVQAAPAVQEEAPPSVVQRGPRRVSLQTASLEELARVKGLNTKIAKEIIKARPFASLEQLLEVRGIGRKTFDKLRSLITL